MENSPITYGPELERSYITSGLDYYKPTMSQLAHEIEPDAEVTFTLKNRGEQRLVEYIEPEQLQARLDTIQGRGFNQTELDYMASLHDSQGVRVFADSFLQHIADTPLPEATVTIEDNDIAVHTTGEWSMATYWETVVMSEVNELYFESYVTKNGLDIFEVYDEGDRRLSEKIEILQQNPDIKIVDFGTRRHFSHRWQRHVTERLVNEYPDNMVGTSNVALANALDIKPIGTFAHEMPMVYAGLADSRGQDIRASHHQFLEDWHDRYGEDLSTVLTDTFTTNFFFSDFTSEQAAEWRALRHDSGDPIEFGERALAFYEQHGIDPTTKTIVFSDGLNIEEIVKLHNHFKDRVGVIFGWGTTLTNDLGIPPLNIVMKATEVDGTPTVKLSDNPGKHTGPAGKIALYQHIFQEEITA
ncbi:MAG TPA: nicotinate phosphoribosyltransferase [Verrucomicrobiae bacterium]|nr:nicotinate phosphoribosyltransferase [Verrucomicrobiae bacterium]